MNVVKEIQRINQIELDAGGNGATGSWHDEYKGAFGRCPLDIGLTNNLD